MHTPPEIIKITRIEHDDIKNICDNEVRDLVILWKDFFVPEIFKNISIKVQKGMRYENLELGLKFENFDDYSTTINELYNTKDLKFKWHKEEIIYVKEIIYKPEEVYTFILKVIHFLQKCWFEAQKPRKALQIWTFQNDIKNKIVSSIEKSGINRLIYKKENNEANIHDLILEDKTRDYILWLFSLIEDKAEVTKNGWWVPSGIIMNGPPGVWKTSILKTLAWNSDKVELFLIDRTTYWSEYISKWENNFRKILNDIQIYSQVNNKQWIILFDEFETIARDRNAQHEAHQAELNVLLRFLDGVEANKDVTFIGSTNTEIKDLDPAITRWGRCDAKIELKLPTQEFRQEMFIRSVKAREQNEIQLFQENIDFETLSHETDWMSFADIENIIKNVCNQRYLKLKNKKTKTTLISEKDIQQEIANWKVKKKNPIGFVH